MRKTPKGYLEALRERQKKSRARFKHQSTGLVLADILNDYKHKSIYMKLANEYDFEILIRTAKDVAVRKNVANKGAYFMKVFAGIRPRLIRKTIAKKPKQMRLKLRRKKK